MPHNLVINIILILVAAWFLGGIFRRLNLPRLLGELLAGILVGPTLLGLVAPTDAIGILSDLGIFFLMFYSGMELDPRELLEHFGLAVLVALGGFVVPFAAGFAAARLFGATTFQALFVAMGLSITAIAVQARILQDMEIHKSKVGHIIIGAAIADDIFALIAFSVLTGLARTGRVEAGVILVLFAKVAGFFGATIAVGQWVMPRITGRLKDVEGRGFTFAMVTALVMGYLAELAGLHLIIGAFLAGQFVRREVLSPELYERLRDRFYNLVYGFLGPVFFVSLSFHVSLKLPGRDWAFLAVLVGVAVLGKIVGCGGPALIAGRGWREALVIGLGMNGRGAVELIVANSVLVLSGVLLKEGVIGEPLLTQSQFTVLVLMAFVTTFMAPLTLRAAVPSVCAKSDRDFCELWRKTPG
jgi:Kef-type K+ transport system membrane component KefB